MTFKSITNGNTLSLSISFYTHDGAIQRNFEDLTVFKDFITEFIDHTIDENNWNDFMTYFNTYVNELTTQKSIITTAYYIYTTINDDDKIIYSKYNAKIQDIINKYNKTQQLLTNELISIIYCNKWTYTINNDITTIKYTQSKNQEDNIYQIRTYKDIIILFSANNSFPHIIKTTQFNVKYTDEIK